MTSQDFSIFGLEMTIAIPDTKAHSCLQDIRQLSNMFDNTAKTPDKEVTPAAKLGNGVFNKDSRGLGPGSGNQ